MRVGACDAKRGSSMLPSPLAPTPERERTLTCARRGSLSSPPHGRAIEHSLLAPCLPLQARARRSRGFAAGSRSRRGCAGRCCALMARCGFEFELPSSGVPFVLFSWQVQSAPARPPLVCSAVVRLAGRRWHARRLHRLAARAVTPSREGEGTDRRVRYLPRAHSLPPKRARCTGRQVRVQPPVPSPDELPHVITALGHGAWGAAGGPRETAPMVGEGAW